MYILVLLEQSKMQLMILNKVDFKKLVCLMHVDNMLFEINILTSIILVIVIR